MKATVKIISNVITDEVLTDMTIEVKIEDKTYIMEFSRDYITRYRILEVLNGNVRKCIEDKCGRMDLIFWDGYSNDYGKFDSENERLYLKEMKDRINCFDVWIKILSHNCIEPVLEDGYSALDIIKSFVGL